MSEVEIKLNFDKQRFEKELAKDIAYAILEVAKRNIEEMNIDTTGTLKNSGEIKEDVDGYIVGFYTPYAVYVETGTKFYAKKPPFNKIVEWVKNKFGYEGAQLYAVAKKIQNEIFERGTEPKPFFRSAIYEVTEVRPTRLKVLSRGKYEFDIGEIATKKLRESLGKR